MSCVLSLTKIAGQSLMKRYQFARNCARLILVGYAEVIPKRGSGK